VLSRYLVARVKGVMLWLVLQTMGTLDKCSNNLKARDRG